MESVNTLGTKRNPAALSEVDPEQEEIREMLKNSDSDKQYTLEELPELQARMEDFAARHHVDIINSNGRKVLREVVQELKPHRVLELGTAIGYSSLLIASNAASDVEIISMELIEKRVLTANYFIGHSPFADRIKIIPGSAGDSLNAISPDERFDFIYIDAAKAQYPDYFRKAFPLLSEHGTIVADNVLFRGMVESEEKIPRRMRTITKRLREYIDIVTNHPQLDTVIRHDGDGLAVSRRK